MAKSETPLLRFLRAMGPDTQLKEQFAADCGTTLVYLYQLAGQAKPNPSLRLAMALREHSERLARELCTQGLSFEDLLVGASETGPWSAAVKRSDARLVRGKASADGHPDSSH